MAARKGSLAEAMKACQRLHTNIMGNKDAGPFLERVDWEAWGLTDYPIIIKTPMDLGEIQRKLDRGEYASPAEYNADVQLVWSNCMTYNREDSEYHQVALRVKKVFDDKFAKQITSVYGAAWDGSEGGAGAAASAARAPSVEEKKRFSQNIYSISAEELGKVVQQLDARCEACIKKIDPDDIEIDIDAVDPATFWVVDAYVKDCIPKEAGGLSGGAGGAGAKKKAAKRPRS